MKLIQTSIPDLVIIEPSLFEDERGWFFESFNETVFNQALQSMGLSTLPPFIQDNHSLSKKNVLRGLHYQKKPWEQGKLVRVAQGAVYDVAVDIRKESPTFGEHVAVLLNSDNKYIFWIPPGFAHGFFTLEDNTHFLYKTTKAYHKDSEASLRWDDSFLAINWPVVGDPILNEKDKTASTWPPII